MSLRYLTPLKNPSAGGWLPSTQAGLSLWVEADSGASASAWLDKTANGNDFAAGNNVTVIDPETAFTGPLTKSISFSSSRLTTASDTTLQLGTGDYILAVLIRADSFNNGIIITPTDYNGITYTAYISTQARTGPAWRHALGNFLQGGEAAGFDAGTPSTGTWYRIIFYRKAGTIYIVQNDVQIGSAAESFNANISTDRFSIGNNENNAETFFSGRMAIALVYKNTSMDATLQTNIDTYMKNRAGL